MLVYGFQNIKVILSIPKSKYNRCSINRILNVLAFCLIGIKSGIHWIKIVGRISDLFVYIPSKTIFIEDLT